MPLCPGVPSWVVLSMPRGLHLDETYTGPGRGLPVICTENFGVLGTWSGKWLGPQAPQSTVEIMARGGWEGPRPQGGAM